MCTSVHLLLLTVTYVGTQRYKRYFIVDRDIRSSEIQRELVIAFPWQHGIVRCLISSGMDGAIPDILKHVNFILKIPSYSAFVERSF
jgi:hypothetical protein